MKSKIRKGFCRKAACIGLTAVMGATFVAGQAFAFGGNKSSATAAAQSASLQFENVNGQVSFDDIKISQMSAQVMQNTSQSVSMNEKHTVIVTLKGESLGSLGTSDRQAVDQIEREQRKFLKNLAAKGIDYEYYASYTNVLNGVAVNVKLADLKAIKAIDGVSTVTVGSTYARPTVAEGSDSVQLNYSNIYENGIYNSSDYLSAENNDLDIKADGTGMTVAILDTGLDYTHEAFLNMPEGGKYDRETIETLMSESQFNAESLSGATASDVYINQKVPFAYDYADKDSDVYPSYSQHGTHVAGIVAGKANSYTDKDGKTATGTDKDGNSYTLPFRGVAPEAQLVICKVFTDDLDSEGIGGAEAVDIVSALDDCCKLGVDIINMSLGTSCGFSSSSLTLGLEEEDEEGYMMDKVYKTIRKQGITLMVAASNDFSAGYGSSFGTNLATNPDSGTVGSPSTFEGAMSVASINGQYAPYLLANADANGNGGDPIYYQESRNEDSDAYNFLNELLGDPDPESDDYDPNYKNSATFKYVVIPGTGASTDYTRTIKALLDDKSEGKVIAVIRRGNTPFKDKIETAISNNADAVIVYNNVSGMVRMSLGDLKKRVPAISVSMDAGLALTGTGSTRRTTGYVTLNRDYLAGPFMNDYSSWGTTPDLKLKPDVTSHGGEIISTVAGGYAEMSGTSMACPNLAGFTALLKGYLKGNYTNLWQTGDQTESNFNLTKLTNNIIMSTATMVKDENRLPYSPRKQGAGLATLKNVFETNAYLYTDEEDGMCEDGRPKAELGDDKKRTGEYSMTFYVKNFGNHSLVFKPNTILMTETLGADGNSVAEKAHLFDNFGTWKVNGTTVNSNGNITVPANSDVKIEVSIKLTAEEKKYIDDTFTNGMFVEGFLQLISQDGTQCDLNFPFMAFYGDWKDAPLMDLDCFEVAADAKNTSLKDEERRQPSVWATQAYGYYWNDRYAMPLGSFAYLQDEAKEHTADYVYTEEEHIAISHYNDYYGYDESANYLTIDGIKALYAGLLRNAEVVTYTLTNVDTGEVMITNKEIYRVGKAYAGGGSATPSQVLLELKTDEMGVEANGKYRLDFNFYFDYEDDYKNPDPDEKHLTGTFSMNFYVDYEAPVLVDSRLRYQERKDENNKVSQSVYLDLDIYDNHYPQAVILCYADGNDSSDGSSPILKLATEYITPIINPKKNSTNTLSIDITELYEEYSGKLFVEIDDYALNHNLYAITLNHSQTASAPQEFKIAEGSSITIGKNQSVKLNIENIGDASLSNFSWRSGSPAVKVKDGEIFGADVTNGSVDVSVTGGNNHTEVIKVTVVDSTTQLNTSSLSLSFGTMINASDAPVKASGTVTVNPAQTFTLEVKPDPWYYPMDGLEFEWSSSDESVATVTQNGTVTVQYEGELVKTATITATLKGTNRKAEVMITVRDPYTVSNGVLTRYRGWGISFDDDGNPLSAKDGSRMLVIPNDRSITSIGEGAFEDNDTVEVVVIPKNVTEISERAFENCTSLKKICFISEDELPIPDSSLNLIRREAFYGCSSLETVDFTNCKVITLDRSAFIGCAALKQVVKPQAIGTAGAQAFMGCTALEEIDLSKLHVAGYQLFTGCTSLAEVTLSAETALGAYMFYGCTSLREVTINCPVIPDYAFAGCSRLAKVTLGTDVTSIGAHAFDNCSRLSNFDLNGHTVAAIGDYAFRECGRLNDLFENAGFEPALGLNVFDNVNTLDGYKLSADGKKLVMAPRTITSSTLPAGVTEIGDYAFSGSTLSGVDTLDLSGITKFGKGALRGLKNLASVALPEGLTEIADEAFANTSITSITIPASVTKIGDDAFNSCDKLASVTFAGDSVAEIGGYAFAGTALTQIEVPESVKSIGTAAFLSCEQLASVSIPAITSMGTNVFEGCSSLQTATFAAGATIEELPAYTFAGTDMRTVTLGGGLKTIGEYAFFNCEHLATIDLKGATAVDQYAFAGCAALATVTGIEGVKEFGAHAFDSCYALTEADLTAAEMISYNTFERCISLARVTFGANLEGIGEMAFAETVVTSVTIPASCQYVGALPFSLYIPQTGSAGDGVSAYTVEAGNPVYFAEDGVLYRYIDKDNGVYELIAYPSGKVATDRTYSVKEGTATIAAYAFCAIDATRVTKVILPHTLKTIGAGAFLYAGISEYQFESIAAPTLLENNVTERSSTRNSGNSFFYNNFYDYFENYAPEAPDTAPSAASTLTISYPTNGTGYDNFVYSYYFGAKTLLGERPEDDARELLSIIEGLPSAETVSGWNRNTVSEAEVKRVAALVADAHALYNGLSSDYQREFVGEENIAKLFAVEQALKPVKAEFGIVVNVSAVRLYADGSTHKTEYREGEKFDLTGLKLLIIYDDNSEEIIDATEGFKLTERYDRELTDIDQMVTLEGTGKYAGMTVNIPITVSEQGAGGGANGGNKLPAYAIALIVVGCVVVVAAAALAVIFIILKKKNKGDVEIEADGEEVAAEEAVSADESAISEAEEEPAGNADEAQPKDEEPAENAESQTESKEEASGADDNLKDNGEEGKTDD